MAERLFPLDDVPEVPLFREPAPGRGAQIMDERISHDYPPEWCRCPTCGGSGKVEATLPDPLPPGGVKLGIDGVYRVDCPDCLGMGSTKAMVRLLAGHRCERCQHPYVPKGDATRLSWLRGKTIEATPYHWSPCDDKCAHAGPVRILVPQGDAPFETGEWLETTLLAPFTVGDQIAKSGQPYEAEWRILTVHHLDGDKANLAWWNLAALCQRCHLEIQARVVMERVYPHEHSPWFKPHAAGYYARAYLGEDLTREQVADRMDELLALELTPA